MPSFTHINCTREGAIAIATLLDSQIKRDELTDELRRELVAAWDDMPVDRWVLDLGRVEFFSSAGIAPLLALHRKLQGRRNRVVLCNVKPAVADMLRVTHLISEAPGQARPFELAINLDDALLRLRHLHTEVRDNVLIVRLAEKELHGEDFAEDIGAEMLYRWQAAGARDAIIDFTPVQVISTPCMRPLLNLRTHVRQVGGRIVFTSMAPSVKEILDVTRLTGATPAAPALFETAADIPAALALLRAP
jgi:anti-anti-sigma factor